ncbi:MAG: DUF423 domain-containing protein [Schleiferiaceae bacterium]|nr:DUF423 domain-containing protein [Schleiferiaceae bacterium]
MQIANKKWAVLGGVFATVGIVLGALGAHALKTQLTSDALASFETGVKYQIYISLFLIVLALFPDTKANRFVGLLMMLGIFFFSFSIYALSLRDIHGAPVSFLGPITPIGGLLMIVGFLVFVVGILKTEKN